MPDEPRRTFSRIVVAGRPVSASGTPVTLTAAAASGRVDVHGLAAGPDAIWIADNTGGFLYRIEI